MTEHTSRGLHGSHRWRGILLVAVMVVIAAGAAAPDPRALVRERVTRLTRASSWTLTASVPMAFPTHHPQGLVKVGDTLFISSVEVRVPTRRRRDRGDGFDRDTGAGVGHLFKATTSGRLLAEATVGEGNIYHPGGIDFDGTSLWVPVAEYRPDSRSIVYRVDPETMKAVEILRVADHLGAIVHDTDDHTLHGVSWGSRWFYRWTLDPHGVVTNRGDAPRALRRANPSHYVDYQDCKYVGGRRMLCSGVAEIGPASSTGRFQLGGLDLVDLDAGRPAHQVPVALWTPDGMSMTRNPVFLEPAGTGLRAYFLPADNASTLYVYTVDTPD